MRILAIALLAPVAAIAAPAAALPTPQAARESLFAAERGFSEQAARLAPAEGIAAMFAPDVVVSMRGGLVSGRDQVLAAMRASPNYQGTHARWRPIGGIVSADGQHGFTTGYLDVDGAANPERAGRRYLAYWVKRPEGWRIAAYRQLIRPASETADVRYDAALPPRALAADPSASAGHARSIAAAEQAFSDRAQAAGLRTAFAEFGRPDSIHVQGPHGFAIGAASIAGSMEEGATSPLHWSSDRTIAASSGDLGLSIGRIYPNAAPPPGQPAEIPFFTVWRRDPGGQWRYIAE